MSTLLERCSLFADVESRALICRKCKCAIATTRSQATTHLDKKHNVPKEIRKGLTQYISKHACRFRDPSSLPARSERSIPHPELDIHKGYACRECKFYTTSFKWLTDHIGKAHIQKRASKSRADDLYDDVFLQTWGDGSTRKYWTVLVDGTVLRPVHLPCVNDHLASLREREQIRRAEKDRTVLADTGPQTLQSIGPWMERTRWPITYQGVRRDILLSLAEIPATHEAGNYTLGQPEQGAEISSSCEDEQKIWHLTQAVYVMLERCEESMRRTGRPLLCWLITTRPAPCFPKPFKFLGRETSRRSYRRWLKRFVAFVFRTWRLEAGIRSKLAGDRLSQKQSGRMRAIWEHKFWDLRFGPNVWLEHQARQGATDHLEGPRGYTDRDDEDRAIDDDEAEEEQNEQDTDQEWCEQEDEEEYLEKNLEDDDSDDGVGTNSSSHILTQGNGSRKMHDAAAELLELLFELSISFMTEEFRDGQPSSSMLIYYTGILALRGTGETFRSAKLYTPILSQLIYIQRLLFLEYALPYQAYPRIRLKQRPRYGQLERLNTVRLKYMVEGAMYPLAEC
jgi:hypothetical protein